MSNEMFQARIPDSFAEEIHDYRKERHMSKSEAVRHLLRAGLEAETEPDTEPEPSHGDISDKLQKGYRLTGFLANFNIILLIGILLLWGGITANLLPQTLPLLAATVALLTIATILIVTTLALTLGLEAARVYTQSDVAPNLGRFDIRRVVLT